MRFPSLVSTLGGILLTGCSFMRQYEVIDRWEKQVPDFRDPGTHAEMQYVLLHEGHRIYASCDAQTFASFDPETTCAFRPLRSYECWLGNDSVAHGDGWDLKCKDTDGHNVYLYVSKKE